MDRPSSNPRDVALAFLFLRDRAGMDAGEIAHAVGGTKDDVESAFQVKSVLWSQPQGRAVDAVIATQSMLLDGYTPGNAAAWFKTPSGDLDGRIPLCEMTGPEGVERVLHAAVSRMSR